MPAPPPGVRTALLHLDSCAAPDPAILSADERARAARFRDARDGQRFASRRIWLRRLLAAETGETAASLRLAYSAHGQPSLADHPQLFFSASHSAGWAMVAIADRPVGCDLERCDPAKADRGVADRFFSPAERAAMARLSGRAWLDGFFAAWTRKEAYVKAVGTGLSLPLDGFSVTLAPGAPVRVLDGAPGWDLHAMPAPPSFAAALVVQAKKQERQWGCRS